MQISWEPPGKAGAVQKDASDKHGTRPFDEPVRLGDEPKVEMVKAPMVEEGAFVVARLERSALMGVDVVALLDLRF